MAKKSKRQRNTSAVKKSARRKKTAVTPKQPPVTAPDKQEVASEFHSEEELTQQQAIGTALSRRFIVIAIALVALAFILASFFRADTPRSPTAGSSRATDSKLEVTSSDSSALTSGGSQLQGAPLTSQSRQVSPSSGSDAKALQPSGAIPACPEDGNADLSGQVCR